MEEKNVTSAALTKKIPLKSGSITQWKQGKKEPSSEEIKRIAQYFHVSVEYLTEDENVKNKLSLDIEIKENRLNERLKNILHTKQISTDFFCNSLHISNSVFCSWMNFGEEIPLQYLLPICQFLDINLSCLLIEEEFETMPVKKKINIVKFTKNNRLKFLREKYEVDAETLAKYIMDTAQNVIMYENNMKEPSHGKIKKMAEYYRVSEKYLLGETNDMQENNIILTIEKNKEKEIIQISEEEKERVCAILSLKNRICTLREKLNLSMEEFGEKINLKQEMIEKYEKGICYPSEQIIKNICLCFDVNETWFRLGKGKEETMFHQNQNYEIYKNMEKLLQTDEIFIKNVVNVLANTDTGNLKMIATFMKNLFGDLTEKSTKKRL